jgi:hypothetical protein
VLDLGRSAPPTAASDISLRMRLALLNLSQAEMSETAVKETTMLTKMFAPETGGTGSPLSDVGGDLSALRKDISTLASDVKRVATYGPELAHESYSAAVRRNPVQSTMIAAAVGFVLCLIITR